ncbi:hypothetical protein J1N35_016034 [Gossypium stocksii]|uniref:Uncharacterized protein n=1 Tax=Gossypium stocksii TaxID=47602 RepID=A0A9D3VY73_9ROSI|nr:hypothetical protein J1N35_016034 [Gossypium stocksii]
MGSVALQMVKRSSSSLSLPKVVPRLLMLLDPTANLFVAARDPDAVALALAVVVGTEVEGGKVGMVEEGVLSVERLDIWQGTVDKVAAAVVVEDMGVAEVDTVGWPVTTVVSPVTLPGNVLAITVEP